ncbi:MAG: hypothetical protein ACQGQO_00880 [Sphaerochaetaceae bacterium]
MLGTRRILEVFRILSLWSLVGLFALTLLSAYGSYHEMTSEFQSFLSGFIQFFLWFNLLINAFMFLCSLSLWYADGHIPWKVIVQSLVQLALVFGIGFVISLVQHLIESGLGVS